MGCAGQLFHTLHSEGGISVVGDSNPIGRCLLPMVNEVEAFMSQYLITISFLYGEELTLGHLLRELG